MNNFSDAFSKIMQKGFVFPVILIFLVSLMVLSGYYVNNEIEFFNQPEVQDEENIEGEVEPTDSVDEEVVVEETTITLTNTDGTITVIPKFDYPVNLFTESNFEELDGFIEYDGEGYLGLDVSKIQGDIDWAEVKAFGVDYVMIRVGYRGATIGGLNIDGNFEANIQGAIDNDIKVGVYFFSQAITVEEAEEEAYFVLEALEEYSEYIVYPVVYDWEFVTITDNRTDSINGSDITDFAVAFTSVIEENGYNSAIYLNKYMAYEFLDLDEFIGIDLWIAEYELYPSFYYEFTMWQYSDQGTVDGIDVNVDLNISFKNYE